MMDSITLRSALPGEHLVKPFSSISFLLILFALGTCLYHLWYAVYNVYFHPLAKFPGPLLARASLLWRFWFSMGGRFHAVIEEQHRRYGSVFRVSPDELSFASATSWRAIYGYPADGKSHLTKSEFYDMFGSGYDSSCIVSEKDPRNHARMRKSLSAAFSTKALSEQETIIQGCVNGFIDKIAQVAGSPKGIDVVEWYEMIGFDILGEMAFGESFHCVEKGEPHVWIDLILKHIFFINLLDNLRRYPLLLAIGKYLLPRWTVGVRNKHSGYTRAQVKRHLENKLTRKDFLTNVVDKVNSGEISREEMTAHASSLVIAGGETVSNFLAAVTYYLLKYPESYRKLQKEILNRYKTIDEIDSASALRLPFLQAVIQEGLRIYPPVSTGFQRISPGVMIDDHWVPPGTEVYTSPWTVTHNPKYFHDPMEFKPERWLDPECKDVKEASQPFLLGPRMCLGRSFAYVEMSLILAKIFFKFDLELINKNLDWEGESQGHILWWKPKLYVRFIGRNGA